MFTGLVQDVGTVDEIRQSAAGRQLWIRTRLADRLREGDSLAVNGVCLTVGLPQVDRVFATAVPESLSRSTLGRLRPGDSLHLECALCAGDPMGGHLVQGHVDGVGSVRSNGAVPSPGGPGVAWVLSVEVLPRLLRYVVLKGSVAIDGVSLTVSDIGPNYLSTVLVPHTLDVTILRTLTPGQPVNIEVDVVAKYVERMVRWHGGVKTDDRCEPRESTPARLTEQWIRDKGY